MSCRIERAKIKYGIEDLGKDFRLYYVSCISAEGEGEGELW